MTKKLAVILGAGASHDLIPEENENMILSNLYAPSVTDDLFSMHRGIEDILTKYPLAQAAIGDLRSRIGRNNNTIEGFWSQLKRSIDGT